MDGPDVSYGRYVLNRSYNLFSKYCDYTLNSYEMNSFSILKQTRHGPSSTQTHMRVREDLRC